jgi:hypothetical protein
MLMRRSDRRIRARWRIGGEEADGERRYHEAWQRLWVSRWSRYMVSTHEMIAVLNSGLYRPVTGT